MHNFHSTRLAGKAVVAFTPTIPLNTGGSKKDLIEILATVRPASHVLFVELKSTYVPEYGTCSCPAIHSTEVNKYRIFSRYLNILVKAGILKRLPIKAVRKLGLDTTAFQFLINPALIRCKNPVDSTGMWDKLTK